MQRVLSTCGVIAALWTFSACSESSPPPAPTSAPDSGSGAAAPGATATPAPAPATADPAAAMETAGAAFDRAEGARLWQQGMCRQCHGADGTGTALAGSLVDDEWLYCDGSVEGIRDILLSGIPKDKMTGPPRPLPMEPATKLVPADRIDTLAAYVRSLSQN